MVNAIVLEAKTNLTVPSRRNVRPAADVNTLASSYPMVIIMFLKGMLKLSFHYLIIGFNIYCRNGSLRLPQWFPAD
jgi:hypothetical protein